MRLSECVVQFDCSCSVGLRLRHIFAGALSGVGRSDYIAVGQSGISESKSRIFFGSRSQYLNRLVDIFSGAPVPVKASLQIELVSLVIVGVALRHPLRIVTGESYLQLLGNRRSDLALRRQQVGHLALELFAPQRSLVSNVNQIDADCQIIAALY